MPGIEWRTSKRSVTAHPEVSIRKSSGRVADNPFPIPGKPLIKSVTSDFHCYRRVTLFPAGILFAVGTVRRSSSEKSSSTVTCIRTLLPSPTTGSLYFRSSAVHFCTSISGCADADNPLATMNFLPSAVSRYG